MNLNIPAIDRLADAPFTGRDLATAFEGIFRMVADLGAGDGALVLNYQSPGDAIEPDDLVPVITLSLRPAVTPKLQAPSEVSDGPTECHSTTGELTE